jgi:hypothetical protein
MCVTGLRSDVDGGASLPFRGCAQPRAYPAAAAQPQDDKSTPTCYLQGTLPYHTYLCARPEHNTDNMRQTQVWLRALSCTAS